jgi:hypothetical protein
MLLLVGFLQPSLSIHFSILEKKVADVRLVLGNYLGEFGVNVFSPIELPPIGPV